jgi:hypothetical protein
MTCDDGIVYGALLNKKAKAAIARYIAWVESHTDGVFESEEDLLERKQFVQSHIDTVKKALERAKRISVYAA